MKQLKLIQISLKYFKGVKEAVIDFDDTTNIYGANATGKTTLFDAFTWLLFGKDSQGRSDSNFDIKTIDENGVVIPKVEHEVNAILEVDGYKLRLKRVLREKWETKRGTSIPIFTGNETICEFDEVPVSITEYNKKIANILDENLFKLITNPHYFNSLNWKDRRNVLINLAGDVTNDDIFAKITNSENNYSTLARWLNQNKTLDELKSKTAQQKKTIKKELDQIPTRIDEVRKGMPEAENYAEIEKQITSLQKQVADIDNQISDRSKAIQSVFDEMQNKRAEIDKLMSSQSEIVRNANNEQSKRYIELNKKRSDIEFQISKETNTLQGYERELYQLQNDIYLENRIEEIEKSILRKREEFVSVNEQTFTPSSDKLICPLYKHFCSDKNALDKFEKNSENDSALFNKNKVENLEKINGEGAKLVDQQKELKKQLDYKRDKIKDLEIHIKQIELVIKELTKTLNSTPLLEQKAIDPADLPEWVELKRKIEAIEVTIKEPDAVDNFELINNKSSLNTELDLLKSKLNNKKIIENSEIRIAELNDEQSKLAQQLADFDKIEFDILEFNKAKMDEVDRRVNTLFKTVKFRLFETQINGSEIETCDTLINTNGSWVPYLTANNAGKINAGIDIINTLCKQNNITAPIFIDNRESVNELIYTDSQIINLIVSHDKNLRVQ